MMSSTLGGRRCRCGRQRRCSNTKPTTNLRLRADRTARTSVTTHHAREGRERRSRRVRSRDALSAARCGGRAERGGGADCVCWAGIVVADGAGDDGGRGSEG